MTTTNYTAITAEQINASLGRETFYGEKGTVYLSKYSDDSFMTNAGEVISTSKAIELIAEGRVSGMNNVAEEAIVAALIEQEAQDKQEAVKPVQTATAFNYRNLKNLVSDGSIFYVEFIKRSTGALRKMKCRTGVKKHLKGGKKAYSSAAKGLLTVFDMETKGYRSIPIEAIKRLTVGGQSFNYAGV